MIIWYSSVSMLWNTRESSYRVYSDSSLVQVRIHCRIGLFREHGLLVIRCFELYSVTLLRYSSLVLYSIAVRTAALY